VSKPPGIPFSKAIEIALEQHRLGNFRRAEALYVEILRQDPGNIDAIHLLGVLAHQGKKPDVAVELIGRAISRRPDVAVFHYNFAEALHALDRREEAVASYQKAVELAPEYFEAHNNLGNVLNELRRFSEAEAACRRAIELQPENAAPYNNLGNALRGLGRRQEAEQAYRDAIAKRPNFANAINNLGICLCSMNRVEEGIEQYRLAIQLSPSSADLHNNLGTALVAIGKTEDAGQSFQTAVDIDPEHAEAHNNLGATLRSLNKSAESVPLFEKSVELNGTFVEAWANLAAARSETGRPSEALEAVDHAISLKTDSASLHFLRGNILRDLHHFDEAIEATRESLRHEPDYVPALTALGFALMERGELDEAMGSLKRSIELKPDPQTHSNVMMGVNYHPAYTPAEHLAAHQGWAELHEKPHIANWKPHLNDRSPDRKLRVGYVSPDFRGHSVSYFLTPVLENHDHDQFEIFGYAHLSHADMSTWRLRSCIDEWREISARHPDQVAELIRADKIDILVEVAGHTANNALTAFARKPAPIQINMIGFPSTTGLSAIDYRVTDELCDPTGVTDPFNTENLLRMPDIFWCYLPPHDAPAIGPLPADQNRSITFTSANNFTKVTPQVQSVWAGLLRAVPNSRLIMQTTALAGEYTKRVVTERFAAEGIPADRLDFRKSTDFQTYLKLLNESDFTLDPFPFNGGTTTCHSLWMGAPVITLAGDRHASRMGLSMMTCIGLPEFVARTPDEYIQIAVTFANDLPRLGAIRAGMRDRLLASPLLDAKKYTRNLEAAYRQVWRHWCANPA
jgi:predicted O-linked N-acetylglucosamine transferase (SPINDLY family)